MAESVLSFPSDMTFLSMSEMQLNIFGEIDLDQVLTEQKCFKSSHKSTMTGAKTMKKFDDARSAEASENFTRFLFFVLLFDCYGGMKHGRT